MNKKGAAWIGYILATGFFISLAVMIILWAKARTEETTESTMKYIEAREECKMVVVDAEKSPTCNTLIVENKGTLTIKKLIMRIDNAESAEYGELTPQSETAIDLSIESPTKSVELLPLIEISKGQLASCTSKRLVVQCA